MLFPFYYDVFITGLHIVFLSSLSGETDKITSDLQNEKTRSLVKALPSVPHSSPHLPNK